MPQRAIPRITSSCGSNINADNPTGDIFIITDNLSGHNSLETRIWLATLPHSTPLHFPKTQGSSHSPGSWWRLFRREDFAGQIFANADEIEQAMQVATKQLNHRAKP